MMVITCMLRDRNITNNRIPVCVCPVCMFVHICCMHMCVRMLCVCACVVYACGCACECVSVCMHT